MSREDANLLIAAVGLLVGVVATWAAVYAIRRDRADLRVTAAGAAMGNRYVSVVNVGLRPVRIERILVRRWTVAHWFATATQLKASVLPAGLQGPEGPLPTVVQPASDIWLHYWGEDYDRAPKTDIVVEDAAGRRYPVRFAPTLPDM